MCNAKNQTEIIVHDRGLFYTLVCQRIYVRGVIRYSAIIQMLF